MVPCFRWVGIFVQGFRAQCHQLWRLLQVGASVESFEELPSLCFAMKQGAQLVDVEGVQIPVLLRRLHRVVAVCFRLKVSALIA